LLLSAQLLVNLQGLKPAENAAFHQVDVITQCVFLNQDLAFHALDQVQRGQQLAEHGFGPVFEKRQLLQKVHHLLLPALHKFLEQILELSFGQRGEMAGRLAHDRRLSGSCGWDQRPFPKVLTQLSVGVYLLHRVLG
jgi:hypothetical protein